MSFLLDPDRAVVYSMHDTLVRIESLLKEIRDKEGPPAVSVDGLLQKIEALEDRLDKIADLVLPLEGR